MYCRVCRYVLNFWTWHECRTHLWIGAGFLIGPTLGSAVWRVVHRNNLKLIDARDRQFYQHIAKNRVDPSLQSPTNPVPDYYGALFWYRTAESVKELNDFCIQAKRLAQFGSIGRWVIFFLFGLESIGMLISYAPHSVDERPVKV